MGKEEALAMTEIKIAIDGYAGCGKSTLAKDLAAALNYIHIDTGALYRGLTLYFMRTQMLSESAIISALAKKPTLEFDPITGHVLLNDEDVESEIRTQAVASQVSAVAAMPEVRDYLSQIQRGLINQKGVVMEGRDIGTVVMTNAELKIFLTASVSVRVERRLNQLREEGRHVNRAEVEENLRERDRQDATRPTAPLSLAADAIVIDTSHLTRDEQLKCVLAIARGITDPELLPFVRRNT